MKLLSILWHKLVLLDTWRVMRVIPPLDPDVHKYVMRRCHAHDRLNQLLR